MTTEDTATRLLRRLVEAPGNDHPPMLAYIGDSSAQCIYCGAHVDNAYDFRSAAGARHEEGCIVLEVDAYLRTLDAGSERADDVGELVEPGGDWYRVEVQLIRAQSPYYDSALCIEAALGIVKRHADAYRYSRPRYGAPGGPEPVAGWGGDGPIDGPIAHG